MTKFINTSGELVHEINDGKSDEIIGIIVPKWRRSYWHAKLKYLKEIINKKDEKKKIFKQKIEKP